MVGEWKQGGRQRWIDPKWSCDMVKVEVSGGGKRDNDCGGGDVEEVEWKSWVVWWR